MKLFPGISSQVQSSTTSLSLSHDPKHILPNIALQRLFTPIVAPGKKNGNCFHNFKQVERIIGYNSGEQIGSKEIITYWISTASWSSEF